LARHPRIGPRNTGRVGQQPGPSCISREALGSGSAHVPLHHPGSHINRTRRTHLRVPDVIDPAGFRDCRFYRPDRTGERYRYWLSSHRSWPRVPIRKEIVALNQWQRGRTPYYDSRGTDEAIPCRADRSQLHLPDAHMARRRINTDWRHQ
jgi:hypothetical protein